MGWMSKNLQIFFLNHHIVFIKNAGSSSSFQICGQMLSWKELLCRDSRTLDVNPDRDLRLFVAVLVQSPSHVQLCGPVDCSMPGLPASPYCSKFSQVDVLHRWCHPAVSSSVALFSFCPQSFPTSGSFQWISSLHQVAKVLELQLQHQPFQWIFRTDFI